MLLGISADIWLYGVCLVVGILLSVPSAVGRSARVGRAPQSARAGTIRAPRAPRTGRAGHAQPISARPALPRYSLLNPIALSAFLGGFGAAGLMLRGAEIASLLSLILALGAGLLLSAAIFRLFVRYVLAAEGSSPSAREAAVGKIAGRNTAGVGLAVASYRHEWSRNDDPHLHVHNVIINATPVPLVDADGHPCLLYTSPSPRD